MRAAILNGTLKRSPQTSNTDSLASNVAGALRDRGVDEVTQIRLVDDDVKPGVESDMELREGLGAPDRRRRRAQPRGDRPGGAGPPDPQVAERLSRPPPRVGSLTAMTQSRRDPRSARGT
jgi:hypothetical protein